MTRARTQTKVKVLVVDDEPIVLELVKTWLTDVGYAVTVREEALGTAYWIAREQPEFVLLDVMMPALSGGELTQLILRNRFTSGTAVILHSSMDADSLSSLAQSSGALGALQKTSNAKAFLAGFERLVVRHHAVRATART